MKGGNQNMEFPRTLNRQREINLRNSQSLEISSIGHGNISTSNPFDWCIEIPKAFLNH